MAKTKRPVEVTAVEEEVEAPESGAAAAEPSKKRPKSEKPMERRKKRKELDKERHCDSTADASKKSTAAPSASSPSSGSDNVLPEFHISVFGDLASSDCSKRVKAAETLVTELEEVQKAYERLDRKEVVEGGVKLEAERDDGLNDCAPSVRYAVRRLVRGVSSSRECARQGFALGLTLLVGALPTIRVDSLMKLTSSLLEVSSSMKGQEVRDCLLGQLFAYGALARSGRLAKEWASDKSTPHVKEFTSQLITLSAKKRYLQEPAVHVLLDLVDKLPSDALKGHVVCAPGVPEWFEGAAECGNPMLCY
ncbi:hypothetical protein MLD38_026944 [Melastoma candidum]|uniref:Uncharacterized protein n=1 Tax=Melastoma candidum TaxID=119954 RepID=A0ACB9P3C3_9MYRT|nr:hypothetical protein MLD38_026944 [Melastoma candidum]